MLKVLFIVNYCDSRMTSCGIKCVQFHKTPNVWLRKARILLCELFILKFSYSCHLSVRHLYPCILLKLHLLFASKHQSLWKENQMCLSEEWNVLLLWMQMIGLMKGHYGCMLNHAAATLMNWGQLRYCCCGDVSDAIKVMWFYCAKGTMLFRTLA
jgi:hypothetical protein